VINCFVFTRTVNCAETVDTAGVLLFQGPVITLLDSIWYANDIGPVKMTSRGNTLEVDSLALRESLFFMPTMAYAVIVAYARNF
jgi:hypothetical protein